MADPVRSTLWWEEPKDSLHTVLGPVYKRVREENQWKRDADAYHYSLYLGRIAEVALTQQSMRGYTYSETELPFNVARSATDTLVAKVGKHRPLPQVLASRGNWKDQKKARKCTQFLEGAFYKHRIFEQHAPSIVRDAAIFRRGGWLFVRRPSKVSKIIVVDRALPWEVDHDDWDGRYDAPRNRYWCRTVDKGAAMATWGQGDGASKRKEAIDKGGSFDPNHQSYTNSTTVKRLDILEAWHLCDNIEAHETGDKHKCSGRHVVMAPQGVLIDEEWGETFLPGVNLRYASPVAGCDGSSLVQQLEGFQRELNISSEVVCEGYERNALTWFMVPDGCAVHEQQLRNGIHILYYKNQGGRIEILQPQPVHPSIYQRQHDLVRDALGEGGLSMMSAQSTETQHEESGVARASRDDIESERHIIFGRQYESWCLNVARHLIACIRAIAEDHGEYEVPVPMKTGILKLNWKDVSVEDYELRVFPTSLLPQQLSARLDKLKMLWESGILDRATFLRLLDATDLQAELDIETADKLVIDEQIEFMLDAEEEDANAFKTPSPYVDLKWAAKRAQQRFNRAQLDGAPEFNLDLLTRWVEWCEKELETIGLKEAPQDAAPGPGMGPIGPAGPMAPQPGAPMPPPGLAPNGAPVPTM